MTQQPSKELHGARFQAKERLCSEAWGPTWRWVEACGFPAFKAFCKGARKLTLGFLWRLFHVVKIDYIIIYGWLTDTSSHPPLPRNRGGPENPNLCSQAASPGSQPHSEVLPKVTSVAWQKITGHAQHLDHSRDLGVGARSWGWRPNTWKIYWVLWITKYVFLLSHDIT